jgi:hypothetical protein
MSLAVLAIALAATAAGARAQQAPARPAAPGQPGGTAQVTTPEVAPPPVLEGILAGRVLDTVSKAPLSRARVVISAGCETPSTSAAPCKKVLEHNRVIVTDEMGRYRADKLPAGTTFVVTANKTGYAPQAFGELPPGLAPRLITLKAREVVENLNVELSPEVVLAGIVQDEDGKPFAGAFVEALRATYLDGRRELMTAAETTTDDRGQFRLSQMSPGQYYVSATDPAFADVGDAQGQLFWPATYYPNASTVDEALRITLDPNVVQEGIVIKLRLTRPIRVGGKLKPTGMEELTAGAIEMGPRISDSYASLSNHRVDIKPDGSYEFNNVSPGRYAIRARGEAPALPQSLFGSFTFEAAGADMPNIDINMSPGAILAGIVEWNGRSRVPGAAEKSNVVVRSPMRDGSMSGDAVTGNLQPDDTFRLRGIQQGLHYLRVEGLPHPWSLDRVEIDGADVTDIPVDFRYGQLKENIRILLTDANTIVTGVIAISPKDVLHGYAVVVFSVNPTLWHPRSRHVQLTRPSNPRGNYFISGLPAGEYYLVATRDIDEGDIGNAQVLQKLADEASARRISIKEGERIPVEARAVLKPRVPPPAVR